VTRRGDRYRVGVDIGGTFTDFILVDRETERVRLHKCLTTPKDPSAGALEGLEELFRAAGLGFADLGALVHGTTLVTNAIIERTGGPLGLLTTRGFRDERGGFACRNSSDQLGITMAPTLLIQRVSRGRAAQLGERQAERVYS